MFRLRQLRKERNITLKAFGKLFGLAESTISLYESEKRQPDMDTMQKFADFFGVTVDYLLGREEQTKNAPTSNPEAEARNELIELLLDRPTILTKFTLEFLTIYTQTEQQRIMDFAAGLRAARL